MTEAAADAARRRCATPASGSKLDDRVDTPFGRRAVDAELKGIPVRVEVGPRDLAAGNVVLVRRIDGSQDPGAARPRWSARCTAALDADQKALYDEALACREARTVDVSTLDEAIEAAGTGWARVPWSAVGVDGEAKANEQRDHRALPVPGGRLGARLAGRARPDRDPGPLVLRCRVSPATGRRRFDSGRLIMHRNARRGRIGWVRPARVVSDDERGLLLWLGRGSRSPRGGGRRPGHPGDAVRRVGDAGLPSSVDRRLEGPPLLKFLPAGADHSVWWFRDADRPFAGWYVNLEEPARPLGRRRRWPASTWSTRTSTSWSSRTGPGSGRTRTSSPSGWPCRSTTGCDDEAAVRAEGRRVIKLIEAGEFPFDGTWCDFAPDPGWPVPTALPPGWDRRPAALSACCRPGRRRA